MTTIIVGRVQDASLPPAGSGEVDAPLYDAELRVGGVQQATRARRAGFEVQTDDGATVTIAPSEATLLLPRSETTAQWGELMDHPFSRLFERQAPGDHVEVTLAGVMVRPGDRVALLGAEESHLEPDGFRGSRAGARTLYARVIATGDEPAATLTRWQEAESAPSEEPPSSAAGVPEPSAPAKLPIVGPLVALVFGLLFVGLGLGLFGVRLPVDDGESVAIGVLLVAFGIPFVSSGVLLLRLRRFLPTFGILGASASGRGTRWGSGWWVLAPLLTVTLGWLFALPILVALSPRLGTGAGLLMAAFIAGAHAFKLHRHERDSTRLLRVLSSTPSHAEGARGSRTLEVALEDGAMTRERREAVGVTDQRTSGVWWEWEERTDASSLDFVGRSADGRRVSIHGADALFGTLVRSVERVEHPRPAPGESAAEFRARHIRGELRADPDAGKHVTRERVAPGTSLLVLARFRDEDGTLVAESTGPESLALFGAPDQARAAARRALRAHHGALATLALLALGGAALALVVALP